MVLLALEIAFTLFDFIIEKRARRELGDVYAGERVTHAVMGIVYGAFLVCLLPSLQTWWNQPTSLVPLPVEIPLWQRWGLVALGIGVFFSGCRDLYGAFGLPGGAWPWKLAKD